MSDIEVVFPKHYLTVSSVVLLLGALVGTIVNIIVIVVVNRAWQHHRKPVYVLVLSGSICSLLQCFTLSPYDALLRLESFRNLITGTPLEYVFCKANLIPFVASILHPISNWTNVSITYNRFAMCRYPLDTYKRKFCRSRTFRWIRFTWAVPILYGLIVIGGTVLKGQLDENNGSSAMENTLVHDLNSSQLPDDLSMSTPAAIDSLHQVTNDENRKTGNVSSQALTPNAAMKNKTVTPVPRAGSFDPYIGNNENESFPGMNMMNAPVANDLNRPSAPMNPPAMFHNVPIQNQTAALGQQNIDYSKYESFTHENIIWNATSFGPGIVTQAPNVVIYTQNNSLNFGLNMSGTKDQLGHDNTSMTTEGFVLPSGSHKRCPFNPMGVIDSFIWNIIIMTFTFVSSIIPNVFSLFAMVYVLRRVSHVDNPTLINWTRGTLIFMGIRALLCLPMEIMLLLRLPIFGVSVPFLPFYFMRDLKFVLATVDPFIFGLRLPDFKDFLRF